jgi:outer membrane protein TolC
LIRIHLSVVDQRLKIEAAQLALDERGQKLSNDVRQAYYQVLQSQIQRESQESLVKHLEELQRITDQRVKEKAALTADRLTVRAELARAAYQLTTIADTLADRKDALNHLLGRSVQTEFAVEPVPATLPDQEDLSAARARALEHRPELKLATNRVRQAALAIKSEKTHYIPDISIQASYFSPANINFLPQNIGSIGALLTWQPWDWGEKRHKVRQAALAAEQAGLAADDTRERILLDVASNFRRLREARAHLAVTEAMRDAENERLRNQEEAYSQRSILLSDLLKQRSSVADAESQYQQAVLGWWSARAEFQKTVGEE